MSDTECGHEARLPLGVGYILARCEARPGHEGEHWLRFTRATVRWTREA